MKMYRVVDSDFNRKIYPDLIGKISTSPPSYAMVKEVSVIRERKWTSLIDLISGIPKESNTEGVILRLTMAYKSEMQQIEQAENRADHTLSVLLPWRIAGSQYIAEFYVNNMKLDEKDEYNWHGQNTSRWLYAGAIVFDETDKRISTHH